ncbi:MAG: hypothetical protein HYX69_03870 [Planctomycetia bacterium]|nr:hypothetical protein [Planctomycetia bacterium]
MRESTHNLLRSPTGRLWYPILIAVVVAGAIAAAAAADDDKQADRSDRIDALIAQLGDDNYFIRERAQQELAKIGFEAFDALETAENHQDIEVASRAKYLVGQMQIEWVTDSDPPEIKRLLANYALKDEADRQALLEQLVDLPEGKGLPVLCRLARFDRSVVLSKLAALAVIEQKSLDDARWTARERAIVENIGRSPRPAAEWLRAYVAGHADPAAGAQRWGNLAEAEEQVLSQQPYQTRPDVVRSLWRQQFTALRRMDRRDEAVAAMMHIVNLEDGTSETLIELLDWLVREQAWGVLDTVTTRFNDRIEREPALLFTVAHAQLLQGKEQLAQQTAERALKLNEGKPPLQHWLLADELRRRGMLKWAELELRHVIQAGPEGQLITMLSQMRLAELLHDRSEDLAAAGLREDAVKGRELKEKGGYQGDEDLGDTFGSIEAMRARMHFFRSCHYESAGDRAKQLEELKAGLAQDPTDADVLIALYRFPGLDKELKEKTREHIRQAADEFRRQIQEKPDSPVPYNQIAWLIANTEGDRKEALAASEKSLELTRSHPRSSDGRSDEAGYLDTLARCHYAVGDLESAVKFQSKAVALDPYSGQMNKQLALFQETLAKSKKTAK